MNETATEIREEMWEHYVGMMDCMWRVRESMKDEPVMNDISTALWKLADAMRSWDKLTPTPSSQPQGEKV